MQGCSLVAEDDLDLVNRSLEIGYLVKRNPSDTMSGTVLSTKVKYTLQPIVYRSVDPRNGDRGPVQFTRPRGHDLEGDDGPPLIVDVDAEDVRVYDEFSEDDYIIYRQKLGIIHQVDRDAVILLSNQRVVTPLRPYALRCPVPSAYLKPIVSLPPDGPEQTSSSSEVWIPCMDLYPGQFVRTTQSNLRRRDWLPGSTSPNDIVEGYVLSTPPVEVHVDWLCSNVFSVNPPLRGPTGEIIRADSLRGEAIIYDDGKAPSGASQNNVRSTMYISAGDRVQFRDPAGAAVKYPAFDRIPDECTWGYDLNIFKVVSVKSEVVVQWQDQSITTEPSTSLHRFTGIENEVWPGEMVSLKEEIRTVPNPSEYAFGPLAFPLDHDNRIHANILQVKKVGIVQKVNSRERIASVRWYENPQVELLHEGHVLRTCSTLGKLGDEITEVSMYELTTHPSMVKTLGEMVLLVPEKVHQSHVTDTHYVHRLSTGAGPCVMSYIFPAQFDHVNMYLEYIKHVMVQQPWFEENVQIDRTPLPRHSVRRRDYNQNSPADWVGQIIALDLDGTITVRLGALDQVRDVKVPFERIMMVLDDDLGAVTEPEGLDDEYPEDEDETIFDRLASVVERSVEYEGGRPLNPEDEDDAMWSTEEEGSDVETVRSETEVGGTGVQRTDIDTTDTPSLIPDESEEKEARPTKPAEPAGDNNRAVGSPPSFAILESEPPEDHHFVNTPLSGSFTKRLRRLQTEYQILETSLPQGIYARTWESRMDLLRVVILGPQGTPYEYAPFVIDFHFGDQFPQHPPDTFFHSWTNGMGRINPNMYEDGKICLSILGTWPPKNPDENWSAERSTVLQILVSIMGLVLVKDPFYSTCILSPICLLPANLTVNR